MVNIRIIPCLQLRDESLVKTVKFDKYTYIGDPVNTVRIFNELEVDELSFVDILASRENREPNYKILKEIADECFMPLSYGGGITSLEEAKKIFSIGFEKVILNTSSFLKPGLIGEVASVFGSQAVVISIDVKKNLWGKYEVYGLSGTRNFKIDPVIWAQEIESRGAGEILLTSIDKEGTWKGFDIELTKRVVDATNLPVIAHGGAGSIQHIHEVIRNAGVRAIAVGSMVVYQAKDLGVLVNFPDQYQLKKMLNVL